MRERSGVYRYVGREGCILVGGVISEVVLYCLLVAASLCIRTGDFASSTVAK